MKHLTSKNELENRTVTMDLVSWLRRGSPARNAAFVAVFLLAGVSIASAADVPFGKHTIAMAIEGASAVYTADVDGDGDLDAIVGNLNAASGRGDLVWFENTVGDGSAWSPETIASGIRDLTAVAAADFDGDGDPDVITNGDKLRLWENTAGDGSAWTGTVIDTVFRANRFVDVGDIDGDGDVDIAGASQGDGVWWFENTAGDGTAWSGHILDDATIGGDVSVADMDRDGDLDIVGATSGGIKFLWWENTAGDGSAWTPHTIDGFVTSTSVSVGTADVDGDGDMDVVGASVSRLRWWDNTAGDGTAWTVHEFPVHSPRSVIPSDVDADGDIDFVVGTARFQVASDKVQWWENTAGDGSVWDLHVLDESFDDARSVVVADLDGDGDVDVLGAAQEGDEVAWWENETIHESAVYPAQTVITTAANAAYSVHAGDVDGDGDLDLMSASINDDEIAWYENDGASAPSFTRHVITTAANGAESVSAGDVDGDGDLDLMSASFFDDEIAWYENDGASPPSFTRHLISTAANGASSVHVGDVDGDGDLDLMSASQLDDEIAWYENLGGQFALPTTDVAPVRAVNGAIASALEIDANHRGRAGDQDVELTTFELLLEDGTNTPLTDAQADALLSELAIYLDDGSGALEPGTDTVVETVTSFALVAGVLTVSFTDADPKLQIPFGSPKKYFVALTFEATASTAVPDEIRVTHLTESSSTGEDADHDLPVVLEFSGNVTSAVIEVNEAPVALDDAATVLEDSGTVAGNVLDGSSGGLDSDEELDPLTAVVAAGPANGVLVGGLPANGDFTYQPNPDFAGVDSFTYRAHDGFETGNLATVVLTVDSVNDAPSFAVTSMHSSDEDAGAQTVPGFAAAISAGPTDESGQTLTFDVTGNSDPSLFAVAPALASDGTLTYTAAADANGTSTITVELMDDGGTANGGVDTSGTQSFDIVIGAVNDAPSFAVTSMHSSDEDAGAQTVPGFATAISVGPTDESGQTLTFDVTGNSDPSLFAVAPVLASDGTLTYTAAADANGTSTITVELMDDGGTANGGVDTSGTQSFDIVIGAVNDVPSFDITPSVTVDQDLGPQTFAGHAFNLSTGPVDEAGQTLTFNVTGNTNPALFSSAPALASDGALTFTSAPLAVGTATITVELMDDGGTANGGVDTSATRDFEIEILDAIAPEVAALDAGQGGVVEDCAELPDRTAALVVGFSEPMADPPGDGDPADVTNSANYQLIASGPDNDLDTLGCNALAGDDVLVPVAGVTFDAMTNEATVAFAPSLGDGIYRLFVCDSLEDPTGNPLDEEVVVTFRQSASSVFRNGHFDCDLRDWIPVSTVPEEIEWSAEDVDGASVSGSVHITNLAGTAFGLGQCVDTSLSGYRVGARLRIDGAADVLIGVTTTCEFFDAAGCAGISLGQSSSLELLPETAGTWLPVESTTSVQGAASALCSFDLALLAGTLFDAYLDALVLPGELFRDGFESGDTSAWSVTVP